MIPPSQRILPGAGSVTANPATVESSALARLTLSDDGTNGAATLVAGGPASNIQVNGENTVALRGGTALDGGKVTLQENVAAIQASGAAGVAQVVGGLRSVVSAPECVIGEALGTVGFRGAAPQSLASLPAPTTPTQAVASVAAGPTQLSEADFQLWKTEVEAAFADIRTSLVDQGLAA